jgi:hypothetical protein
MHSLRQGNAAWAALSTSLVLIACGGAVAANESDAGMAGESGGDPSARDGSPLQLDGGGNGEAADDYIVVYAPPDGAGSSPDAFVPSCNVGGSSTCDLCLSNSCCLQVEACQIDPTCKSAMACLVTCEENGGSGLACSEGECSKPADQETTNLFTCGSQQCASPCYMN